VHSVSKSFWTLLLQLAPDGPGKVQSCVVRLLTIRLPLASIDHCIATPKGVMLAPGICSMQLGVMGIAHSYSTSLLKDLMSAAMFSGVWADLWFPRSRSALMSVMRSCSGNWESGYVTPCWMMFRNSVRCG
jgi:hypothetical protein